MTRRLSARTHGTLVSTALGTALIASALVVSSGPSAGAAPAVGAEPGSAGVGDPLFPTAGNGGYDVSHYGLRLRYAPQAHRLRARAVITARATTALSSFHLDFSGLRIDSVLVDGAAAGWSRHGHELVVEPPQDLADGARFVTRVRYHGSPQHHVDPDGSKDGWVYTDDGAVVANEPVGAMTVFPCNNHPSDKARYDVAITVPRGLTGVSNGRLASRRTADGWTTWRWHEPDQMATYLMTATIGKFRQVRAKGPGGVPVRSFVDPRVKGGVDAARTVPSILRRLVRWYGPYPFVSSGVIIDRASLGYALEVQTRPLFDFRPGEGVLVHELAHQWFGDQVSPRTWQHIWLNEGFATYTEWLWDARRKPGAPQDHFDQLYSEPSGSSLWSPPPADPRTGANLFGWPVYARGAMALHQLRREVGVATYLSVARRWVRIHGGDSARTGALRRLAERVSGDGLRRLFHDWLWLDGKPPGY